MSFNFIPIFPNFVLHKTDVLDATTNAELAEIARNERNQFRIKSNSDSKNLGDTSNHFGHVRHNLIPAQMADAPTALHKLVKQAKIAVDEFLLAGYGFTNTFEYEMAAETFYQQDTNHENIGIFSHTHFKSDFVCTYYPSVKRNTTATNLANGALRFYDPSGKGQKLWANNNKNIFSGAWFQVVPNEGSMVVFEGNIPHDSSYFDGSERICIPMQMNLLSDNIQHKVKI